MGSVYSSVASPTPPDALIAEVEVPKPALFPPTPVAKVAGLFAQVEPS